MDEKQGIEQNPIVLSGLVGVGAWLGVLAERIQTHGTPLVPFEYDPMKEQHLLEAEAKSFGAVGVDFGWPWEAPSLPALEKLVRELYRLTLGKEWQEEYWHLAIQRYVRIPYPLDVARDMLTDPMFHSNLAHSMQHEEIWFAVASDWPEAASKLAASRYDNPVESWDRVLEIITDFSHPWVLEWLTGCEGSSTEKRHALVALISEDEELVRRIERGKLLTSEEFDEAWDARFNRDT